MAGAARKKDQIPFNADVLKWARGMARAIY